MAQKITVSGIIINNEKILLVKRSSMQEFFPEYYEFPGGRVEFGEAPGEAIIREVEEETGLSTKLINIYTTRSYLSKNGTQHNVELFYFMELLNEKIKIQLSHEHTDYMWVNNTNLNDTKLPDNDPVKLMVREILS